MGLSICSSRSDSHCEVLVLSQLREDMRKKQPDIWHMNNQGLHHDNAPAPPKTWHLSATPFFFDLAPCDFFLLFPKMEIKMKGWRFDTIEEIQAKDQKMLKTRHKMISSRASDCGRNIWIDVYAPKGVVVMGTFCVSAFFFSSDTFQELFDSSLYC